MKFQYKVEGHCSEGDLNLLGEQGWELISCDGGVFRFKRSQPDGEVPRRETFTGQRQGCPPMPKLTPQPPDRKTKDAARER